MQAVDGADLLLTHPLPLVGPIVAQKERIAVGVERARADLVFLGLRSAGAAADARRFIIC